MLKLAGIDKYYNAGTPDEAQLFDGFDLDIADNEFLCVIGSNGSGKTSLLNIVCGDLAVDAGQVCLDGVDITKRKNFERYASIGRVFQDPAAGTCPTMTILENMALADNKGKRYGLGRGTDKARIEFYCSLLEQLGLGLENKLQAKVESLSGDQRQALALLMSTMTPLKLLILDEHTAALDPKTAEITMRLTHKLVREKGLTTVMVTHNLRYALEYGNRIIMLHEGRIILDAKGAEKDALAIETVLEKFNEISIEYGN